MASLTFCGFAVDWQTLRGTGAAVGAAVRIGAYSGDFRESAGAIAKIVRELIDEAAAQNVPLAEVQIDFDAAASKLAGYRVWLAAAQAQSAGVPVTITALPSWLDAAGFADLAHLANNYVLQVHGLDRPRTAAEPVALCDPAAARRAVEKAARLGVPFRVALPTYGYIMAFERNSDGSPGRFTGLMAENAPDGWGEGAGKELRVVEANAGELADLVRTWFAAGGRPAAMTGVIWYRLPVAGDQLNWRWQTLSAVMAGRQPAPANVTVEVRPTPEGAREIVLCNGGESDAREIPRITVRWKNATLLAADSLAGCDMSRTADTLQFTSGAAWNQRLHAGEQRVIGWVRLNQNATAEQEVQAHVESADNHGDGGPAGGGAAAGMGLWSGVP